ncbi:hypothetical protein Turpa_0070 [Turneriella parva DSM 21527]|uniref:Uncharacterized protein n=1 Tax=Turneriella parva (strain ATCC BAA-1111 / DSM 21527 / NCTC 11395 / H) TaxID=869212 RepID=I4B0C6_TURPD|nr:hypothetical protein Turpa_0070 [Turneriella parva DSM 21527]
MIVALLGHPVKYLPSSSKGPLSLIEKDDTPYLYINQTLAIDHLRPPR